MKRFSAGIIPGTAGLAGVYDHERGVWTVSDDLVEAQMTAGRLNAAVAADVDFLENALGALPWEQGSAPQFAVSEKIHYVTYLEGPDIDAADSVVHPRHLFSDTGVKGDPRTLEEAAEEAFRLILSGDGHEPAIVQVSDGAIVVNTSTLSQWHARFEEEWRTRAPQP